MRGQSFEKVQQDLHDPAHSVGATIKKDYFMVIGNGPGLTPVGVDPFGRLWSEGSGSVLTCIYDPRMPAMPAK